MRLFLAVLTLFLGFGSGVVAAPDGPYVVLQPDGSWLARSINADNKVDQQRLKTGDSFVVPAVGEMPAFAVHVRNADPIAPGVVALTSRTSLFVVADTHGEYEIFGELLRQQHVVDASLRWSFGKAHLVILGDVFDRGANQVEILWLLYELQSQAAKAGGGVHLLLGNHEAMVMMGDLRYLNQKYVRSAHLLGARSYSELVAPDTVLGQWLRTRSAVLKIRDLLCLHGGIAPDVVARGLSLEQINETVRSSLNGVNATENGFVMGPIGPLWYRGYFPELREGAPASAADIDRIRKYFGVSAIVVGHTRVPTVTPLYEGRVVAVHVYPHRDEGSGRPVMEALMIKGTSALRATIAGTLEPLR